jgi:hypothetical protein
MSNMRSKNIVLYPDLFILFTEDIFGILKDADENERIGSQLLFLYPVII